MQPGKDNRNLAQIGRLPLGQGAGETNHSLSLFSQLQIPCGDQSFACWGGQLITIVTWSQIDSCKDVHTAASEKYLEILVGLNAPQVQWDEVLVKARTRVNDIRLQGQFMAARVYPHVCGQLVEGAVCRRPGGGTHLVRASHPEENPGTFANRLRSAIMIHSLSVLGQPNRIRYLRLAALLAKCRAVTESAVFSDVDARVRRACASVVLVGPRLRFRTLEVPGTRTLPVPWGGGRCTRWQEVRVNV